MAHNLATRLRDGTKTSHTRAERVGFITCFLKGVVEPESYRGLIANLYFVYVAMEEELERLRDHPVVGRIRFPELHREQSLAADLAFFFGDDWRAAIAPSPATRDYVARIHEVARTAPELLVAHSYTRYLGDLSGGQILGRITRRALGLRDDRGWMFYAFFAVPDATSFKNGYRRTLDELPIDDATAERIVAEANAAFEYNMHIFQELEGSLIRGIGAVLFGRLTGRQSAELRPAPQA